jgi:hypothetical protein
MQSKHNLFKYCLKEAIINLIKIKSSDQMFTACVCIGLFIKITSTYVNFLIFFCHGVNKKKHVIWHLIDKLIN